MEDQSSAVRPRLAFIDWMKALGMFVIVFDHVGARILEDVTPPIHAKQLGVAFFMFVIGYGLTGETRPGAVVIYRRLFPIFFFGLGAALAISAIGLAAGGGLQPSNYLPLLLGVNVIQDHFPANPTTWYIGTYIQLVLLWAVVLRRLRVTAGLIALCALAEVFTRAGVIELWAWLRSQQALPEPIFDYAGGSELFTAYMLLPNWATVFLLGAYARQRDRRGARRRDLPWLLLGWGVLAAAWALGTGQLQFDDAFPFRRLLEAEGGLGTLLVSAAVTGLYAAHTWLAFQVVRRLAAAPGVEFFARNTLLIFILHMPVWYAIHEPLRGSLPGFTSTFLLELVILYGGLALVSEGITRVLRPDRLRDTLWTPPAAVFSRHVRPRPSE